MGGLMEDDEEENAKAVKLGVAAVMLVTELMRDHEDPKTVATILMSALAFHIDGFQHKEARDELIVISDRYIRRTVGRRKDAH